MIVDFAIDAPAGRPPVVTAVGPTFDPEELAGRKLAALFGRAEARDFADVFVLAQRFDRSLILQHGAEVDLGFDVLVLAEMMSSVRRASATVYVASMSPDRSDGTATWSGPGFTGSTRERGDGVFG